MQKFKVGDKVKVVDLAAARAFCVPNGAPHAGTVSVTIDDSEMPSIQLEGHVWYYPENCLAYDRKFDPKPGDTIVCRGGSRWTACAVEDYPYREYHPEAVITTEIRPPHHNHMVWKNFDGIAENTTFDIVEVIPATTPVPKQATVPKTYTVREVMDAIKEAYDMPSATDPEVASIQKLLDRRDDPDYTTYLELKKRFETKD